jgi:TetR/AcrR family transcriptional regulator, repressor for uid operon
MRMSTQERLTRRDERRLATRARLFDAAVAEFKKAGVAAGDIDVIVTNAGVAHGTFFFHFETKDHVLAALGQREERRIAARLDAFLQDPRDLSATLRKVVALTAALERRLGRLLFRDMLGLYFSPTRPEMTLWTDHPVIARVITEFRQAREQGSLSDDVDPVSGATFFFLAHYALMVTQEASQSRTQLMDELVATVIRGVQPR